MNGLALAWWLPVWAPLLLLVLYGIALGALGNVSAWPMPTWLKACIAPFVVAIYVAALLLDVALNYTLFCVYLMDRPQAGEYTLSKRLPRLNKQQNLRGRVARAVTWLLNTLAADGQHIAP